jgi:hypothetical protein
MSKSLVKIRTPKLELAWVNISGEGKENLSGKIQYVATGILEPKNPDHKAFIDSIDEFWANNKPKFMGEKRKPKSIGYRLCDPMRDEAGDPVRDDEDKIVYDKEGRLSIQFSTATAFPDGSKKKVRVYNAKAKEVALGEKKIGNGSIGFIAGAMDIYIVKDNKGKELDAGVTFYLDSIQLTKFVEFSNDPGFEAVDGDDEEAWTGDDFEGEEVNESSAPSAGVRL